MSPGHAQQPDSGSQLGKFGNLTDFSGANYCIAEQKFLASFKLNCAVYRAFVED